MVLASEGVWTVSSLALLRKTSSGILVNQGILELPTLFHRAEMKWGKMCLTLEMQTHSRSHCLVLLREKSNI